MLLRLTILLLTTSSAAAAPLDPLPSEAYRWRILVRMPKHPLFHEAFRSTLTRELQAALQPNLGLLGTVEIVDTATANDPIAKQFHERGWAAFEVPRPLDGLKHHGLIIEARDGAYHLSARQYDGFTGLLTPLLRTRTVRSIEQIPRAASALIEPDFALAATVERSPTDAMQCTLVLRAHKLADLTGRVKIGDLFAVAVVKASTAKDAAGQLATPIAYTLLKVLEPLRDGRCQCAILSRFATPFGKDPARMAGFRALRITTVSAELRLRLVDRTGKPHPRGKGLVVTASDIDFTARPTKSDGFEWRDGLYRSTRPFAHLACISVGVGADRPQLFPVPILNDDVITLSFGIDAEAERRAVFLRDCSDLRSQAAELSQAQVAMVASMNDLITITRNRDALARAEAGREKIIAGEKQLRDELKLLQSQPGVSDAVAKAVLASTARQLDAIRDGQTQLAKTIQILKDATSKGGVAAIIEKELRAEKLKADIQTLLTRGDVPEALKVFDTMIAEFPAQQAYKDEREKLNALWATKDEAHRVARDVWRSLANAKEPDEFVAACTAMKKAAGVLQIHRDKLGLLKFNSTIDIAHAKLNEIAELAGRGEQNAEAQDKANKLESALGLLRECESVVQVCLQGVAAAAKESQPKAAEKK